MNLFNNELIEKRFQEDNEKIYSALLQAISRKIVGNRPDRQEPRVVKRRPKAFPRMQKARHLYRKKEAA